MTATNDTNRPVLIPNHPRKSPRKGAIPCLWLLFRGRCSLVFLCGQIASPARQLLNFFPLFLCFLCQLFLRLGLVRSDTKIYLIHTHVSVSWTSFQTSADAPLTMLIMTGQYIRQDSKIVTDLSNLTDGCILTFNNHATSQLAVNIHSSLPFVKGDHCLGNQSSVWLNPECHYNLPSENLSKVSWGKTNYRITKLTQPLCSALLYSLLLICSKNKGWFSRIGLLCWSQHLPYFEEY